MKEEEMIVNEFETEGTDEIVELTEEEMQEIEGGTTKRSYGHYFKWNNYSPGTVHTWTFGSGYSRVISVKCSCSTAEVKVGIGIKGNKGMIQVMTKSQVRNWTCYCSVNFISANGKYLDTHEITIRCS